MTGATYLCGGDTTPGPRGTDCPSPLHDHPLPEGYVDAAEEAASRLYRSWASTKCGACGLYGWTPRMTLEEMNRGTWECRTCRPAAFGDEPTSATASDALAQHRAEHHKEDA